MTTRQTPKGTMDSEHDPKDAQDADAPPAAPERALQGTFYILEGHAPSYGFSTMLMPGQVVLTSRVLAYPWVRYTGPPKPYVDLNQREEDLFFGTRVETPEQRPLSFSGIKQIEPGEWDPWGALKKGPPEPKEA